jgi:hypothetical protein
LALAKARAFFVGGRKCKMQNVQCKMQNRLEGAFRISHFAFLILHFALALSNYSFKTSVKGAGMELPTFLKERFDGC